MLIHEALVAHLSGVTAAGSRIEPAPLRNTTALPAITYQEISNPRAYTHQGQNHLAAPTFQITYWAATRNAARTGIEAIRLALSGFRGLMGGAGGVTVGMVTVTGSRDEYDQPSGRHYPSLDARIVHEEAVPV